MSLAGGGRLLRGMLEGRYRDDLFIGGQAEYRFPLWWRFGGVTFAGLGRVAGAFEELDLTGLKHSVGAGLRFAVKPDERINLRFDAATADGAFNLYFGIGEAF
jgi:outer membrane translocation and assembly module TamA